ncbi:MAG: RnfABCDGE type electron transport complex subunit B [Chitinivibrionales bacterium]
MAIVFPVFVMGSLGMFFGIALGITSKKLHVLIDSKINKILAVLPNINCGACGHPACSGFAKAVARGKSSATGCVPGGSKTAHAIADILGTTISVEEPGMAVVHCKGGLKEAAERSVYEGLIDCHAATVGGHGSKVCANGCLGLGSCVSACPFNALSINADKVAVVNPATCNGCGKCVPACPRNIIGLIPRVHKIFLACSNRDCGARVKKYCSVGCTACAVCVTSTPSGAIEMTDNLPVLDYSREENFIVAVHKCPSACFVDLVKTRPKVNIDIKCDGCGECVAYCPVDAIHGERAHRYIIDKDKCIGCGLCLNTCHVHAIALWGGLGYVQNSRGKWQRS